jgi:hypothetical protein
MKPHSAMSRVPNGGAERRCRYKGVRWRQWGKWVSEIRVPDTRERQWLGSYAAHDAAACLLRGPVRWHLQNFPGRAACYAAHHHRGQLPLSPRSVQRVASDAGMAAGAQLLEARERAAPQLGVGIAVIARGGEEGAGEPLTTTTCSGYHPGADAMAN